MCEVVSFKNFENNLTAVKVMMKTKVAPFYLGHGVVAMCLLCWLWQFCCILMTMQFLKQNFATNTQCC